MLLEDSTFNEMKEFSDWYMHDVRVIFDISDFALVQLRAERAFNNMPLTDLCYLWSLVTDSCNCRQCAEVGTCKSTGIARVNKASQWLKDNRTDLESLYYFYKGWVSGLEKETYEAFEDKIESTDAVFALLQDILANTPADWWLPVHKHSKNK